MKTKDLAKMMLIYEMMYVTEKPTRLVQSVTSKIKKKLRYILTNQEAFYREAEALQKDVYDKAWAKLFKDSAYISLGVFMNKLYMSIEKQKLIGHAQMKKVFDAYYHSNDDKTLEEIAEMEANAHKLAKEVMKLLGDKVESPLKRRAYTLKQNLIIEGKI